MTSPDRHVGEISFDGSAAPPGRRRAQFVVVVALLLGVGVLALWQRPSPPHPRPVSVGPSPVMNVTVDGMTRSAQDGHTFGYAFRIKNWDRFPAWISAIALDIPPNFTALRYGLVVGWNEDAELIGPMPLANRLQVEPGAVATVAIQGQVGCSDKLSHQAPAVDLVVDGQPDIFDLSDDPSWTTLAEQACGQ